MKAVVEVTRAVKALGFMGGERGTFPNPTAAHIREAAAIYGEAIPYYMAASRIADEPHLKHYYLFLVVYCLGNHMVAFEQEDFESYIKVTEGQLVEMVSAYEYSKYCPVSGLIYVARFTE